MLDFMFVCLLLISPLIYMLYLFIRKCCFSLLRRFIILFPPPPRPITTPRGAGGVLSPEHAPRLELVTDCHLGDPENYLFNTNISHFRLFLYVTPFPPPLLGVLGVSYSRNTHRESHYLSQLP